MRSKGVPFENKLAIDTFQVAVVFKALCRSLPGAFCQLKDKTLQAIWRVCVHVDRLLQAHIEVAGVKNPHHVHNTDGCDFLLDGLTDLDHS